jgi:O-antigen/teichoic acid export membrane protein
VALYAFALAPIEQIRGWYKNISPLALPKLANRSFKEINALLLPRMAALSVIGVAIASIYVLAAPFVFAIFFPQYAESVLITQLLAGILALRLPGAFFSTLPQAKMQYMPKSWLYWETVPNVVLIGSYFILIPAFGIYGAIASRYLWIFSGAIIGGIRWRMLSNRQESAV